MSLWTYDDYLESLEDDRYRQLRYELDIEDENLSLEELEELKKEKEEEDNE